MKSILKLKQNSQIQSQFYWWDLIINWAWQKYETGTRLAYRSFVTSKVLKLNSI